MQFIHAVDDLQARRVAQRRGAGDVGRALAEKALAQSLGEPSPIALSTIARRRRAYYDGLAAAGRSLDVTEWLRRTGDRRHTRYWLDLPGFEK